MKTYYAVQNLANHAPINLLEPDIDFIRFVCWVPYLNFFKAIELYVAKCPYHFYYYYRSEIYLSGGLSQTIKTKYSDTINFTFL